MGRFANLFFDVTPYLTARCSTDHGKFARIVYRRALRVTSRPVRYRARWASSYNGCRCARKPDPPGSFALAHQVCKELKLAKKMRPFANLVFDVTAYLHARYTAEHGKFARIVHRRMDWRLICRLERRSLRLKQRRSQDFPSAPYTQSSTNSASPYCAIWRLVRGCKEKPAKPNRSTGRRAP